MSPKVLAWLSVLFAFIVGIASGFIGAELMRRRGHPDFHRRGPHQHQRLVGPLLERFAGELELSVEQEHAVREILDRGRDEIQAMRRELRPKMDRIHRSLEEDIAALLSPEQRSRYEDMLKRREGIVPPPRPGRR